MIHFLKITKWRIEGESSNGNSHLFISSIHLVQLADDLVIVMDEVNPINSVYKIAYGTFEQRWKMSY
jgi:hypothetical protein